jgi:hypothetical protein
MPKSIGAIALAALIVGAACARAYPPPGGERDTQPPRLIATTPAALEVVSGFTGPAVFRFDERLSERNFSETLVVVSPADSTVRVERGRTEVRVSLAGGWRPNRVYRITLLPGVRDLFGNARTEQAEIVFSTGPPVPATAVAGIVQDRITGRPAASAVVRATRRADQVVYTAVGDQSGFFSLRHLPLGAYDVRAFTDQNRNRRHDPAEPADSTEFTLGAPDDTLALVFNVLPRDTTPPRVTAVAVMDSLRLRVTFDDYFDVAEPVADVSAEVHALPDSVRFAGAVRVLQAPLFEAETRAAPQAADTAAAPPRAPPARTTTPLPTRDLVVVLERPLERGTRYTVTVRGATNISGLTGGGTASFETQAPPRPPPPAPPDTAARR